MKIYYPFFSDAFQTIKCKQFGVPTKKSGEPLMRICLLGDFTGTPDEGMKNTARQLKDYLEKDNEVIGIHPREVLYPEILKTVRSQYPPLAEMTMKDYVENISKLYKDVSECKR